MKLKIPYSINKKDYNIYSAYEANNKEDVVLEYKCPFCNELLILKGGNKIIFPYFTHKRESNSFCVKNEKESYKASIMCKIIKLFRKRNSIKIPSNKPYFDNMTFKYNKVQFKDERYKWKANTSLILTDESNNEMILTFKFPFLEEIPSEFELYDCKIKYLEIDLTPLYSDNSIPEESDLCEFLFENLENSKPYKSWNNTGLKELDESLISYYKEVFLSKTKEYINIDGTGILEYLIKKDYGLNVSDSAIKLYPSFDKRHLYEKLNNIREEYIKCEKLNHIQKVLHKYMEEKYSIDNITNVLFYIYSSKGVIKYTLYNQFLSENITVKTITDYNPEAKEKIKALIDNHLEEFIPSYLLKIEKNFTENMSGIENMYNIENRPDGEISFYQCMNYINLSPNEATINTNIDYENSEVIRNLRDQLEETLELKLIDGLKDNSIKIEFPELNNCKPRNIIFINCFLYQFEQIYNILQEESSKVFLKSYVENGLNDLLISKGFDDSHRMEIKEILDKYKIVCKDF